MGIDQLSPWSIAMICIACIVVIGAVILIAMDDPNTDEEGEEDDNPTRLAD